MFQVPAGGGAPITLASFSSNLGFEPQDGLIADAEGNLYGTTSRGGTNYSGTVFEVPAGGGTPVLLATFAGVNGSGPQGPLIADAKGNLYGTTASGGAQGSGTVFEVPAGGGNPITLTSFNGTTGGPLGNMIADAKGNFYGTTIYGGTFGAGTVFELPAGGSTPLTLASFDDQEDGIGNNGDYPYAGLAADAKGNLYGTTIYGGTNADGNVFEIPAGGGTPISLASFSGSNGLFPKASLLVDAKGNLFGTCSDGTKSDGTVFEVPAGGGAPITLATFNGTNGSDPLAGLIADSNGNLYGTTSSGGANGDGTVFELSGTGFVVPEPTTLSLLALAAVGPLSRRRR